DVEVEYTVASRTRPLHERPGRSHWWQIRTIEVRRQVCFLAWSTSDASGDEGRRLTRQHLRPIKRKGLRAEKRCARRIEHIHAHVISIGPYPKMRIVEKVRAQMK